MVHTTGNRVDPDAYFSAHRRKRLPEPMELKFSADGMTRATLTIFADAAAVV